MAKFQSYILVFALMLPSAGISSNVATRDVAKMESIETAQDLIPDKATDLARFLYSQDVIMGQVGQVLDQSLPIALKNDPDFSIYEEAFPGFVETVVSSIKPAMLQAYIDKMPLLWIRLSQHFRNSFTPAEIDQLHAFYSGPVGIRFIATLRDNADSQAMVNSAVKSDGSKEEMVGAAKEATAQAIRKTRTQLSAADRIAILRFENSPIGRKLGSAGATAQNIVLEWDLYFTQQQLQEFDRVRSVAIEEFLAKVDAEATEQSPVQ